MLSGAAPLHFKPALCTFFFFTRLFSTKMLTRVEEEKEDILIGFNALHPCSPGPHDPLHPCLRPCWLHGVSPFLLPSHSVQHATFLAEVNVN